MTVNQKNNLRIRPDTLIVGVMGGKGGVGKSTTAARLAAAYAATGKNVTLADLDVSGANAHILSETENQVITADRDTLTMSLPASRFGFNVLSPEHIPGGYSPQAVESVIRCVPGVEVLIVDLPGGWSNAHDMFMGWHPHAIVAVCSATVTAVSDHASLMAHIAAAPAKLLTELEHSDKRRNWTKLMPEPPKVLVVETMSTFIGYILNDDGSETNQIAAFRRQDVEDSSYLPSMVQASEHTQEFVGALAGGNIEDPHRVLETLIDQISA